MKDMRELNEAPLVGASCEPLEDDIMKWFGIVVAPEGTPYAGIPIRFTLEFSSEYPQKPPNCFFDHDIRYAHGAVMQDSQGRYAVCLNLFNNFAAIHTEWSTTHEGWSPAYTVKSILLSMQALMLSDMLSTRSSDIEAVRITAASFKCAKTNHDGSDPEKWFPCVLLDNTSVSKEEYSLDTHFYVCYASKVSLRESAVLGLGVSITNGGKGILSSPCEYLSELAFLEGCRSSSTNIHFDHWIPILIQRENLEFVLEKFINSVKEICAKINFERPIEEQVLKVCSSIMCSLIIEVMKNENNLTANDKFIHGYVAIYRLLVEYAAINARIVEYVDQFLTDFKLHDEKRKKENVPNLGELLVGLTICNLKWIDVADAVLLESDTRSVFWYCVGNYKSRAQYSELYDTSYNNEDRVDKVFRATHTGRSFIMFQVNFVEMSKKLTSDILEANHRLATADFVNELKETYLKVNSVTNWDEYFSFLKLPSPSRAERNARLIEAVKMSDKQGYTDREKRKDDGHGGRSFGRGRVLRGGRGNEGRGVRGGEGRRGGGRRIEGEGRGGDGRGDEGIRNDEGREAAKKPQTQAAMCGGGFAALNFESSDSDESPRGRIEGEVGGRRGGGGRGDEGGRRGGRFHGGRNGRGRGRG